MGEFRASILMVAWRAADTITDAIDGALAQTVPCEIIVSDDASPDDTFAVAQAHVAGYSGPHRLIVRRNDANQGVTEHLNSLMRMASGDVFVVMAGDDISLPDRVHDTLAAFDADPSTFVLGTAVDEVDMQGQPLRPNRRAMPERFDLAWFARAGKLATLLGATISFRRAVFDGFGPLAGTVEDNVLSLRGALLGGGQCLPQSLVRYRKNPQSLGNWLFARGDNTPAGFRKRYERTIRMYRAVADDLERAAASLPELAPEQAAHAARIVRIYRLEAEAREAILDRPRSQWLGPIWRGLNQPGLRRKSFERAFKLLLPRKLFGKRR